MAKFVDVKFGCVGAPIDKHILLNVDHIISIFSYGDGTYRLELSNEDNYYVDEGSYQKIIRAATSVDDHDSRRPESPRWE